ncbi:MAG: N-acetylmuramic acid 6-phosphate etherase [Firmicutes bacterium]|nr:N-acetylmuramic acid 6-phosphate etherase [Bacillota bacterium]MDH7496713.1 N-acetylmuramic acid 6-phosphate etherase [Bacillota bacterium]
MENADYVDLATEETNPRSRGLDQMSTEEILRVMNEEDRRVPAVVAEAIPDVARAVDMIAARMAAGGKLVYVGAGTSGRLGILDAVECVPTFGVSADQVCAVIAGGPTAVFRSVEAAEDDEPSGAQDVAAIVTERDVVVGISASGVTPYVKGALKSARNMGAATVAIVCNHATVLDLDVDVLISLAVGPEVLTGSTRLKAGTAQKLVLNMISTATMVRLGRVYDNFMVDMKATNRKLRSRAVRMISAATGLSGEESVRLLDEAGGNIKTAIVMALASVGRAEAERALESAHGHAREAVRLAGLHETNISGG